MASSAGVDTDTPGHSTQGTVELTSFLSPRNICELDESETFVAAIPPSRQRNILNLTEARESRTEPVDGRCRWEALKQRNNAIPRSICFKSRRYSWKNQSRCAISKQGDDLYNYLDVDCAVVHSLLIFHLEGIGHKITTDLVATLGHLQVRMSHWFIVQIVD